MDDPRLDESFSFKKGDSVLKKDYRSLRAKINDGVYIGEFPKPAARAIHSRGKTLYEIKLPDAVVEIVDETEIENIADES